MLFPITSNVALANTDGSVDFQMQLPAEGLTLKNGVSELVNPGDAVIVRLTGELTEEGYQLIPPDQIRLE
jgi:hypothetical protein